MHLTHLILFITLFLVIPAAYAADPVYQRPPQAIAKILEAAPSPVVSLDPTRTHMVLLTREAMPSLSDLAAPMLRLGGSRVNPNTNGPHGPRAYIGMTLRPVNNNSPAAARTLQLPDASIGSPNWSHDGSRFVFTITFPDRIELWICDVASAKPRKLIDRRLNAASGGTVRWLPDGNTLLVKLIPASRGSMPVEPAVPAGPVIQETFGSKSQARTWQDLLKNPHDEALFDWLMTAQLALVNTDTGALTEIAEPAIYSTIDPAPGGQYLLTSRIEKPYSYTVPASEFPETFEIRDATGRIIKQLWKSQNRELIPIEGVEKGPRDPRWHDTAPATLIYAEALDEGDPKNKVPKRDRIFISPTPFSAPQILLETEHRFTGIGFFEQQPGRPQLSLVSEYDRDRKWSRSWLVNFDDTAARHFTEAATRHRIFRDLSINDRYNNPGSPLTTRLPSGRTVYRVENESIYMVGAGATPNGNLPFLDQKSLTDLSTRRLWRSAEGGLESVVDVLSDNAAFITGFESPTDVPNYYRRDLNLAASDNVAVSDRTPLTAFTDPVPELRNVKKQLVKYQRADGVELSATMYLPPDYQPGTRLPLLIWAYPLEYTDKSTAGQVSAAPSTFVRMGGISHLLLVMAGYAVMDEATMPVVGEPETVNDTFISQIVSSAQAAIDKAVEMGIADRDRVAVGGHSYGAFMTANLLAHCDLFRAGLARSGAYNRTLTPFGFQGERRTYWEALDTYTQMSPFTHADKIKTPLLMIHGQIDNNPGTFPMQSERLYAAIKGLGGTARFVTLPFESHGYAAKESALHTQYEMLTWLDTHVKNAAPRTPAPTPNPVIPDPLTQNAPGEVKVNGRSATVELFAWRDMMPGTGDKSRGLILSATLKSPDGHPLGNVSLTHITLTQDGKTHEAALVKEDPDQPLTRMLRNGPPYAPGSRFDARVKVLLPDGNSTFVMLRDQEVHRAD